MSTYTIGETADRSGFSASALRYYEGIGLVAPSGRTDAGYRMYDDHALDRLAFIARAKQLGCSLEDISELVGLWDGEQCASVQRHLHDLVSGKLGEAGRQVSELTALTAQLRAAAAQLAGSAKDGPCDESCACVSGNAPVAEPVALVRGAGPDAPPIACTLDDAAMPDRLADWRRLVARARTSTTLDDGARRVEFGDEVTLRELARLVAAEQECCAFLSFAITVDHTGIGLEVRAPEGAEAVVESLLGGS